MKDCWLWLTEVAGMDINEIDMAVPMSPEQVVQKRIQFYPINPRRTKYRIKDKTSDFWLRVKSEIETQQIQQISLTEYQAIEAFKRYKFKFTPLYFERIYNII